MRDEIVVPDLSGEASRRAARERIARFVNGRPNALKRALLSGEIEYDPETEQLRLVPARSQADLEKRHRIAASASDRESELRPDEVEELQAMIERIDTEYLARLASR